MNPYIYLSSVTILNDNLINVFPLVSGILVLSFKYNSIIELGYPLRMDLSTDFRPESNYRKASLKQKNIRQVPTAGP